jgi:hypothetical protein
MDLNAIAPIVENIIKDVLSKTKYPYNGGTALKKASGNLIDYISVRSEKDGDLDVLTIYMVDYAEAVDQGRSKGSYVPVNAIMKWLQDKGINVRDDRGRLVKGQQKFRKKLQSSIKANKALPMAYAISASIKNKGIRPTYFMEEAINRMLNNKKIDELLENSAIEDLVNSLK